MKKYRYELRIMNDFDYNGFADVGELYFTNGICSYYGPGGSSDKRFIGKTVLCRLSAAEDGDRKGYRFEGMAEVLKFSDKGRPVKFGEVLHNRKLDGWKPPSAKDKIYDGRK